MSDVFFSQLPIILASGSHIRARLLSSLGLSFDIIVSGVDEDSIKKNHEGSYIELGFKLARTKAITVSEQYPNHLIIGADQLCICNNQLFDKPLTMDNAKEQLLYLSGKIHQQISCVALAFNGEIIKEFEDVATMQLLNLDESLIMAYLSAEMPLNSCGSYQYEGLGKWLFKDVSGHDSTILGLPLLKLKKALLDCSIVSFIPFEQIKKG